MKKLYKTLITVTLLTTASYATDEPILGTVVPKHLATAQDYSRPRSSSPLPFPTHWEELVPYLNQPQFGGSNPGDMLQLLISSLQMIEDANGGSGQAGAKAALIFQQQLNFITQYLGNTVFINVWEATPTLTYPTPSQRYPIIYQFLYNRYQSPTTQTSERSWVRSCLGW